jgi:RNA polymerase sigma-70 factor (ECF subfamily)
MDKGIFMLNLKKADDHELIKDYTEGNELAFDVLINRHRNEIYKRIYLIVRDRTMAEDILQDSFIRMMRSIRSRTYNEDGKFLPWALTIARNICIDYKRKNMRSKNLFYKVSIPDNFSQQTTTIKCRLSQRQLQQQVELILNKLPEVQRTVIQYRHFEQMSFKEISQAMGTNMNTTMGRMRYGLKSLNKIIGNNRSIFQ